MTNTPSENEQIDYNAMETQFSDSKKAELDPSVYHEAERYFDGSVNTNRKEYEGVLTLGSNELSPEQKEKLFQKLETQFSNLPAEAIFAKGSTYEDVKKVLENPKNPDDLKNVYEKVITGGGRLYVVFEDGTPEFIDNTEKVPMFVKNPDGTLQNTIYNRNHEEIADAIKFISDNRDADWASVKEMEDWATKRKFELFEAEGGGWDERKTHSRLMKLVAMTGANGKFVGGGSGWMATALKGCRYANFDPDDGGVDVRDAHSEDRNDDLGLVSRLRVYPKS